jgi:two-component system LytT family response regulator
MKYRAIIIDDERLARKEMRSLLAEFDEIIVAGEAEDIASALMLIEDEKPDLVFLDIQLSHESGFELLEKTEQYFRLIFVTAFDAYAVRAFEVNAIDYLLKPVNPERLAKAIERLGHESAPVKAANLFQFEDRIFLQPGGRSLFLKVSEISHIAAANDYSEVFTSDKRKFLVEKSLREWETRLPLKNFLRIHRGILINLEEIEHIENWSNRTFQIRLKNYSQPFNVSRRYAVKLKDKFT